MFAAAAFKLKFGKLLHCVRFTGRLIGGGVLNETVALAVALATQPGLLTMTVYVPG